MKVIEILGTDPIDIPGIDRRGSPITIKLRQSRHLKDGVQVLYNERDKRLIAVCQIGQAPPHGEVTAITVSPMYYEAIKKSHLEQRNREIVRERKSFFGS